MFQFRRIVSTALLMAMTATGTATVTRLAESTPVTQTAGSQLPSAPVAQSQNATPAMALSSGEMSTVQGEGIWGWLKKIWKKHKKKIIKTIWEIIKEIIDSVVNETAEYVEGIDGEVVEHHEGQDQTEEVYNSREDYEAGSAAQSSSYSDYGYSYQYTDYSSGSYEY